MGLGEGLGRVVSAEPQRRDIDRRGEGETADGYLRRLAQESLLGADLPRADVLRALREVIGQADAPPQVPRQRRARAAASG